MNILYAGGVGRLRNCDVRYRGDCATIWMSLSFAEVDLEYVSTSRRHILPLCSMSEINDSIVILIIYQLKM